MRFREGLREVFHPKHLQIFPGMMSTKVGEVLKAFQVSSGGFNSSVVFSPPKKTLSPIPLSSKGCCLDGKGCLYTIP